MFARFVAFLVDFFIVVSASVFLGSIFHGDDDMIIWRLLGVAFVYEALFVQERGQTLGKAMADIHVVTKEGDPPSAVEAWTRALIKTGQFMCCGVTLLAIVTNKPRRGIHDLISGTQVVKKAAE